MRRAQDATAAVWRDRVTRWKQSGLTAKAFAQLEGLPRPGALSWWRHRLASEDKKKAVRAEDGPLRLEAMPTVTAGGGERGSRSESAVATIEVACGDYRIIVRSGFDVMMLEGVLRASERAR